MKRENIEIRAQILEASRAPKPVTMLLLELKLIGGHYKKHFQQLVQQGLLEFNKKRYKTTTKGLEWLKLYKQLRNLEKATLT